MEIYLNGVLATFLIIMWLLVYHSKDDKYDEHPTLAIAVATILVSATSWAFVVLKVVTVTVSMLRGNGKGN